MLRYLTAGESHGQALVVVIEGLPAGLEITVEQIQAEMARRRLGYGRGPRQRFEEDELTLVGGVRHGRTLGSPLAIEIKNTEWFRSDKWHEEMSPAPGRHQGSADPGPPGPRRPRRDAEVRVHRCPRRARTGERARDSGARGRRCGGQGTAEDARRRHHLPRDPDGLRRRSPPPPPARRPISSIGSTRTRCAVSTSTPARR